MKIKQKMILMLLIICSMSFIGCGQKEASRETYVLGTIVKLKVYGKNAEEAVQASINKLSQIEEKMSVNKPNSEVSKLNKSAGKKSEKVSKETYYVINKALKYSKLSQGNFDISVEPLVKLWGIGTDKARVPSKEEIDKAKQLINYKDIEVKENGEVYLKKKGMEIDLGGIAKGYAADKLKKIIKDRGITSAFINLGGNVDVIGNKTDGSPWKIGIQNPIKDKGQYMGILTVSDKSIVTSGNYERYFIKNNKRYHHIFDIKTGYPAEKGLISATIVSDNSIDGDALSTSAYVLGLDKAINLIESLNGIEGIFITKDKKVYVTSGLKTNFELTDKEFTYEKGR
ncbi:FAD:protein FMN transferase [Haloimpatiens sp. FM7330]|uniref:FAD:protein FMN transferase n=1 Tax=Haloimpatiens sp. FM7330 TaxID=3298610 RepID=UPI00363F61F0